MEKHTKRLGILGGGQLGRMSAMAAKKLNIETVIYTDTQDGPASHVASKTLVGDYTDHDKLKDFANDVDVISYEFENIPLKTIEFLKTLKPVYPDNNLLEISQDRVAEKTFLNKIGVKTTRWSAVKNDNDLPILFDEWNAEEIIIKTSRFGYNGKGQKKISRADTLSDFDTNDLIAEYIVDFDVEISVIIARDIDKGHVFYGPVFNHHRDNMLYATIAPGPGIENNLTKTAHDITKHIAESIDLQGVLTVEFFVTKDGDLLVNEIAPRTHNSGHYSIDACEASQFENHVATVCGMKVKDPKQHAHAQMINLIGEDVHDIAKYMDIENVTVHLYDKKDAKAGRKMGHVNIIGEKL